MAAFLNPCLIFLRGLRHYLKIREIKKGKDLNDTIRVSADLVKEGGPYAYYHRGRDKKLMVKIPKGVRHGQRIRLAGMGEDARAGGSPGDLYLKVETKFSIMETLKKFLP